MDADFAARRPATVVGAMSGTSLDGLDLALVRLARRAGGAWDFALLAAETLPYDDDWRARLEGAFAKTGPALDELDAAYGRWLGGEVRRFAAAAGVRPDLVASHGHTVHHRPREGYTRQIGDPRFLQEACGIPVVADFRTSDVALGGQGAPLVPVADRLLFGAYAQCLNLGGFANVSHESAGGRRLAYDVTVVNVLLNRLAEAAGRPYDAGGAMARAGRTDEGVVARLDALPFYGMAPPKSLGREWLEASVWPVFAAAALSPRDALATATAHVARQLAAALARGPAGEVLVTGGGAYNTFLISRVRDRLPGIHRLVLPEGGEAGGGGAASLVDFKEAVAFALLGALRVRGEPNALASVTGAARDSSGGVVIGHRTAEPA